MLRPHYYHLFKKKGRMHAAKCFEVLDHQTIEHQTPEGD